MKRDLIHNMVISQAKEMVAKINFGHSQIDISSSNYFVDLGMNSLDKVDLLLTIKSLLSTESLPNTILLSDTIYEFAERILSEVS